MSDKPTILVTGAGGFIGGRTVEMLYQAGNATIRAGVRRWASAVRIGRLPIDIVRFDLRDPDEVAAALEGVDAIIHCAVGDRSSTVDGTRNLLDAALRAGVERVVHLSTIDVYGETLGQIDESTPRQRTGRPYGDTKIEAEEVCEEYSARGLPVVILRPTIVYGPYSESWTVEFAGRLQADRWMLPAEDCDGVCNLVYVDDLVAAIQLALDTDEAVGKAFNVNGPDDVTWMQYFSALNAAMGRPPLVVAARSHAHLTASLMAPVRRLAKFALANFSDQIMALYKRYALVKLVMRKAEGMIRQAPSSNEFAMYSRKLRFPTAAAAASLGYHPAVGMDEGVARSVAWLRHHDYVPAGGGP